MADLKKIRTDVAASLPVPPAQKRGLESVCYNLTVVAAVVAVL